MNKTLTICAALAAAASLSAQGNLSTATGYGDFARAGRGATDGVPAGTAIGPTGLSIAVRDADPSGTAVAHASTDVGLRFGTAGAVVTVQEDGSAATRGSSRAAAGTSSSPRQPMPGPHGLAWHIAARPGAAATVVVSWQGSATANASTTAVVDVDGDGTPDFGARVSGGRGQQARRFDVVAGARGFVIGIATSGLAGSGGGVESYGAMLSVAFQPQAPAPTCAFRPFGPECGGRLDGRATSVGGRTRLGLGLSGAAANALVALAVGDPLPAPVPLPGTRCALLVNPRVVLPGRTDADGNASWAFGLPPMPALSAAFQAVTLELGATGARLASSNGLGVMCQ